MQTRSLVAAAQIGTNIYVKFRPSFLPEKETKITKTMALSFTPEFSHHAEFVCPLIFGQNRPEKVSLAELLMTAEVFLEVWHQPEPGASPMEERHVQNAVGRSSLDHVGSLVLIRSGDVYLGKVTVPLSHLLLHRTGLRGWYPITLPEGIKLPSSSSFSRLETVGGTLEVSVFFPLPQTDREKVLTFAKQQGVDIRMIDYSNEEFWQEGAACYLTISGEFQ